MKTFPIYPIFILISLTACTTNMPAQNSPHHQPQSTYCRLDYPKPAITPDSIHAYRQSPEFQEWDTKQRACQGR